MLGQGASGETWLCVDRATGREVAIKFMQRPIPEVELPRLEREIKVWGGEGCAGKDRGWRCDV
eukprot:364681-Chlamydomonas_euryale.AAC.7